MCGRFVSARERQELIDEFLVERDEVTSDAAADYNVAPTDPIFAVLSSRPRQSPAPAAKPVPGPAATRGFCGAVPAPAAKPRASGVSGVSARP